MISSINDYTRLNNGINMPWLGLGVFQMKDDPEVENAVEHALRVGYRSLDTASVYGNERGVGRAIRASGVSRADIFLTTKVWNEDQRAGRIEAAFAESLERLDTDYVDLYLVHWPVSGHYRDTWRDMQAILASGRAKAIGVSNFLIPHLEDILSDGGVVPSVNQLEFHPRLVQPQLLEFCQRHDIRVEAWSPLMQAGEVLSDPAIVEIAQRHGKTPAQVILRWDLQHGVVTIPKSVKPHRIEENANVFDFELTSADMAAIDALDRNQRCGPDPANFDF